MRLSEHARGQAALWGTDPQGWLEFGEQQNLPLFEAVLAAAGVRSGTRLLDVGCGTGGVLVLASEAGASVAGLDVAKPLLDIACSRLPEATLVHGELDELPFEPSSFDAVVGVNAFQFAGDPARALAEAHRVLVPGGRVVASLFAEPERSESSAVHAALSALTPPETALAKHAPYLLSAPGNLERTLTSCGFLLRAAGEVTCTWQYRDVGSAVRGILSSAGGARAVAAAGRVAASAAVISATAPYTDALGLVRMRNTFRWVSADKSR